MLTCKWSNTVTVKKKNPKFSASLICVNSKEKYIK